MALPSQHLNVAIAPGAAMERRLSLRYALHARAVFAWDDESGQHRESRGHTRDVGRKGAFIVASQCPPSGSLLSLSIFLPITSGETSAKRIEAQACVVRVEHACEADMGPGFAVIHQRVDLFTK